MVGSIDSYHDDCCKNYGDCCTDVGSICLNDELVTSIPVKKVVVFNSVPLHEDIDFA